MECALRATWATLIQRLKAVRPGPWLVPVILFVALYLWRPFTLGFYSDDWSSLVESTQHGGAFSGERFEWFYSRLAHWRPLLIPLQWLTTSVLGGSAAAWQVLMAALVAVSCFMLYRFLLALGAAKTPATIVAGLWLAFPWSLGYTAWPICYGILVSLICFLAGSISLLHKRILSCFFWYLACMLIYEAFYFQFAGILVFLLFTPENRRWVLRRALPPLVLLQAAMIVANRLAASHWAASARTYHGGWLSAMGRWLVRLPATLSDAVSGGRVLALATIGLAGLIVVVCIFRVRGRRRFVELLGIVLAFILSCVVLAVAGYYLASIGLASRTTVAANLWIVAFVALCWRDGVRRRWLRLGAGTLVALVFAMLAFSTFARTYDWHRWWVEENNVLEAVPLEDLKATGQGAVILVVGLPYIGEQPVFGDNWGMSAAVANTYPDTRIPSGYRLFIQARAPDVVSWDGSQLYRYGQPDGWTAELWRWTWPEDHLEQLQPNRSALEGFPAPLAARE